MHLIDRVYGESYIDEPVIRRLIDTPTMRRLEGITQYGLPRLFYPAEGFSRFEHSVGVMILLRNLRAGLSQVVAGLLHDVSHTAFSHVTDGVFGDSDSHNAQDERHAGFVMASELPGVISAHGLDPVKVADLERHKLLDRETPDLCADRVDYALREFAFYMPAERLAKIVDDLTVFDGRIIFSTYDSAETFGVNYMNCHLAKWASPEKTVRQHLFARMLRLALASDVLRVEDLFQDDQHALNKLVESKDPRVIAGIRMLSSEMLFVESERRPQLTLSRRLRYVDPEFIDNSQVLRLSSVSSTYRRILESHKDLHRRPLRISFTGRIGPHAAWAISQPS
ncbi:MAG: HD domain-containing protein [Candidatus Micrarchaeia archaeon]